MSEVVKVQIPLFTDDPKNVGALIYDRHKKHVTQHQLLDVISFRSLGDDPKGYFEAEWISAKGEWQLGRRTKDRNW